MCEKCAAVIKKGTNIKQSGHSYKYGVCTVCGESDPDYKPAVIQHEDDPDVPKTGENSNIVLWIIIMLVAGAGLIGCIICSRKTKYGL